MKRVLSVILAISLILALLQTFAFATETETTDPAGTLEYLPSATSSATTFTVTIRNTGNAATVTLAEKEYLHVKGMQKRRIEGNVTASGTYPVYQGLRFTVEKPGKYTISFKDMAQSETSKASSGAPGIYFFKVPDNGNYISTELNGDYTRITTESKPIATEITAIENQLKTETDAAVIAELEARKKELNAQNTAIMSPLYRKTILGSKDPLGYFNFNTATTGVYETLKDSDNNDVVLDVEEAGDYFVILSMRPESLTYSSGTYGSTPSQQYYIGGIKLTPVPEMNFGSDYVTIGAKSDPPADWTVSGASGWTINAAIAKTSNYMSHQLGSGYFLLSLKRSSSGYEPWSQYATGNNNNNIKSCASTLQLKTAFGIEEGYYRIKLKGGKVSNGAMMTLYVDNQFAGYYDCYDAAATDVVLDENEAVLNTVYVTPDEDGTVEVMVASEGEYDDGVDKTSVVLSKISFEYLGKEKPDSATADKIIIENAPEALEAEGVGAVSAYVLMKDGSKRQISGLKRAVNHASTPLCATTDSNNSIKITTSDNLTFAADFEGANVRNGVFTNASGNATGTVTANGNGEATITVNAKVDGVALTPVTATVALPEVEEPGEEIMETVTLGVMANFEAAASGITSNYKGTNQVEVGTSVTAKAEDIEGYKFAYWKDGSRFLSANNEIKVTVARNTALIAVYDVATASTAGRVVEFWNADKTFLSKVENAGDKVELPEDPEMTGHEFIGWYTDDETPFTAETTLTADVTRVVAQYELSDTEYTVTVDGAANTGKYDALIEKTASGDFTYWALNNAIMSFNSSLNFLTYGNATIAAVKDDAAEIAPTIVLDKVGGSFFIAYETPAGFERIEAGIIFGTSADINVNSCYSKASAKNKAAFGQFTAKPMNTETYARGYQIFKKDGKVLVIYTDAIEA